MNDFRLAREALGKMLFPDNGTKAFCDFGSVVRLKHYASLPYNQEIASVSLMKLLWDLDQSPQNLWRESAFPRLKKGLLAGELLELRLACAIYHPEHWPEGGTRADRTNELLQRRHKLKETYIKDLWMKFQCVAHLWAAWDELLLLSKASSHDQLKSWWDNFQGGIPQIREILAQSEAYRRLGEKHKALLKKTVKLPDDIRVHEVMDEEIIVLPLPPDELDYLDQIYGPESAT